MCGCLGGLEERLEDALGGLLGERDFELGVDLVHDASTGPAVGELCDDRGSRPRNACGAKFVREFAERGLVKAVVGARRRQCGLRDRRSALRRAASTRRDPAFKGVELLLGIPCACGSARWGTLPAACVRAGRRQT